MESSQVTMLEGNGKCHYVVLRKMGFHGVCSHLGAKITTAGCLLTKARVMEKSNRNSGEGHPWRVTASFLEEVIPELSFER